jgi:hypothetical protein
MKQLLLSAIEHGHGVKWATLVEIHTETEPSSFEIERAIEKLKRYKSKSIDQIHVGLIQVGDNTLPSKGHKYTNYIYKKKRISRVLEVVYNCTC